MVEIETRRLLVELAASLYARGYSVGSAGNISVRMPDGYLFTPTNSSLGRLERRGCPSWIGVPSHFRRSTVKGGVHAPSLLRFAPNAGAVVHLHSTMATAVACLPDLDPINPIPPLTPYFVMRVGRRLPLVPYYRPGNPQMEAAIHNAARIARTVLLANHGAVACGKTLTDAVYAAEELEEAAKLFITLRGVEARMLTQAQVDDLVTTFG